MDDLQNSILEDSIISDINIFENKNHKPKSYKTNFNKIKVLSKLKKNELRKIINNSPMLFSAYSTHEASVRPISTESTDSADIEEPIQIGQFLRIGRFLYI